MIFKLPRKRWLVLAAIGAAFAVAVPVAWATFTDVGPENPFYNDINAIQGAGITQGCGGGNFCPNDTIKRQAEAAFLHRIAPRVAQSTGIIDETISASPDYPTDTHVGQVSIDVGGVAGGTQFVKVESTLSVSNDSGTTPYGIFYYITSGNVCTATPRS